MQMPPLLQGRNFRAINLLLPLFLAACTNPELPFSKDLPAASEVQSAVQPPWDALVEAKPGAENDLDLETLDGPQAAGPNLPQDSSAVLASDVPQQVAKPEIELQAKAEPKKDAITIRYVAVPIVRGASGSGNAELTGAMRQVLKDAGWPVLDSPRADAIAIRGKVVMGKPENGSQKIQIVWEVVTPKGKKIGEIKQENAVNAGSLDALWGENAGYATEAAAQGIFKLIQQFR